MTIVRLHNLKLEAIIGTNDWERNNKQPVIIDIEFQYDSSKAAMMDDLHYAVDYYDMKNKIAQFVKNSSCKLIETLASEILKIILNDHLVSIAKVRINKPSALENVDSVSVEVSN